MCHGRAQTRMKKLEQVRLEVDSRRHTVSALAQKIEKQRAKLTAAGDRAKSEENIETTIRRMQHKENKLAGAPTPAHALSWRPTQFLLASTLRESTHCHALHGRCFCRVLACKCCAVHLRLCMMCC